MSLFSPKHAPNFQMHYEIIEGVLPRDCIFIHGNLASNRWWGPSIEELKVLARQNPQPGRAILAEWRGCGKSSAPASLAEVNMEDFARDYIALAEELGLKGVDIVGHSTGGLIAALAAQQKPEMFHALFLLDPVGPKGVTFHESMHEAFAQMKASREVTAMVIGSTIHNNDPSSAFFNDVLVDDAFTAVNKVGSWVIQSLAGYDVRRQLEGLSHPVKIVHGDLDQVLPMVDSRAMANLMPNSTFESWEGFGHCANIEDPKYFANAVLTFLSNPIVIGQ